MVAVCLWRSDLTSLMFDLLICKADPVSAFTAWGCRGGSWRQRTMPVRLSGQRPARELTRSSCPVGIRTRQGTCYAPPPTLTHSAEPELAEVLGDSPGAGTVSSRVWSVFWKGRCPSFSGKEWEEGLGPEDQRWNQTPKSSGFPSHFMPRASVCPPVGQSMASIARPSSSNRREPLPRNVTYGYLPSYNVRVQKLPRRPSGLQSLKYL